MTSSSAGLVDSTSGIFKLAFLPEGLFSVNVSDSSSGHYSVDNISVNAGSNFDLGDITL